MNPLYDILIESGGEIGGSTYCFTINLDTPHMRLPDSVFAIYKRSRVRYVNDIIDLLHSKNSKADTSDPALLNLIKRSWTWWKTTGFDRDAIPFRFCKDIDNIKVSRLYIDEFARYAYPNTKSKTVGGITFILGNGTITKLHTGLIFEKHVYGALCELIVQFSSNKCDLDSIEEYIDSMKIMQNVKETLYRVVNAHRDGEVDSTGRTLLKELNDCVSFLYTKYKNKPDDEIVRQLYKLGNKTTNDVIIPTGAKDTKRFIKDIFNDKEFKKSGATISDITLNTPPGPVYISIKESNAQLSGIVIDPKNKRLGLDKWMASDLTNDSDTPSPQFTEFFERFGLKADLLYTQIKQRFNHPDKNNNIILKPDDIMSSSYNGQAIARDIDNLIGGGYWYLSPKHCLWVPDEHKDDASFELDEVRISGSGKGISITGHMGQLQRVSLRIRTTGGNAFRIFPVVNMVDYLSYKTGKNIQSA